MAKRKGVSDSTLQKWWRKDILASHNNICIICGSKRPDSGLECHHIVKRRARVLRHDPKNGVPVCVGKCHQIAHTLKGERIIAAKLGEERMDYLAEYQQVLIKDYCKALSFSKEELEVWELKRLKEAYENGR